MSNVTLNAKLDESLYALPIYPKRGITLVRGKGSYVWDDQGKRYIDCTAGHGVTYLGHCHSQVVKAITKQAKTLIACSNTFDNDARARAFKALAEVTGAKRLYLCNSGTEAMEAAIKFARLLTGKRKLIAMKKAFHGRTAGALSLTWNPKYREPFEPLLSGVEFVAFNEFEALQQAATAQDTAAIILEMIQGEGGVNIIDIPYLQAVRKLCSERNILLIIDEIQTGLGRTGKMFAFQYADIVPDIVTMAKGIANGLPMGATAFYVDTEGKIESGHHGSTFGGNPLVSAACEATLRVLVEQDLPARAFQLGALIVSRLRKNLRGIDLVKDIRGLGLMIGIELRNRAQPLLQELMDRGVLALPAGPTVIRLLPPLNIPKKEVMLAMDLIVEVIKKANVEFIKL